MILTDDVAVVSFFVAITASTVVGRLSTRITSVSVGIRAHSAKGAFVRYGTDVG